MTRWSADIRIALDTNVLVYAHRAASAEHRQAVARLTALVGEGHVLVVVPFVAVEFLRVATHPRVLRPPSTPAEAAAFLEDLLGSGSVEWGGSTRRAAPLVAAVQERDARGNDLYDIEVALAALDAGAGAMLTNDRDFPRLERLEVLPLQG